MVSNQCVAKSSLLKLYVHVRMYVHVYMQYRSDARYKARVKLHEFARRDKRTCALRRIHVYTQLNGFIQADKPVDTRRQTSLPYSLYLTGTVHVCICTYNIIIIMLIVVLVAMYVCALFFTAEANPEKFTNRFRNKMFYTRVRKSMCF